MGGVRAEETITHLEMKHTQTHCAEIYCEIRKPDDEDDNGNEKN